MAALSQQYSDSMKMVLQPKYVALCLFGVVLALTLLNSVILFFYFYLEDYYVYGFAHLFDLDIEGNVPSLYSAAAIIFSSLLLFVHAAVSKRTNDGMYVSWLGLAAIMLFLGVDEGVAIHEKLSDLLEEYMDADGFFYYLWVIPYAIATSIIGLVYVPFLLKLPARTRALFLAAGFIFVTGAIGVEVFAAREADLHGEWTMTYCVLYSVEEFLEMIGIVVFIYALLSHHGGDNDPLSFSVEY